jgi:hypothetical protein
LFYSSLPHKINIFLRIFGDKKNTEKPAHGSIIRTFLPAEFPIAPSSQLRFEIKNSFFYFEIRSSLPTTALAL